MNSMLSETDTRTVIDILINQLAIEEAQVTPDAKIQEDLGADSLDVIEIVMAVEERFNVTIPDEVSEKVSTIGDLVEVLAPMLGNAQRRVA